jgi:hypothetical protein
MHVLAAADDCYEEALVVIAFPSTTKLPDRRPSTARAASSSAKAAETSPPRLVRRRPEVAM